MTRRQRNQTIDLSLAVNPTQPVQESKHLELWRVIADQPEFFVPRFGQQRPAKRRFADQTSMLRLFQGEFIEFRFPSVASDPLIFGNLVHLLYQFLPRAKPHQATVQLLHTSSIAPRAGTANVESSSVILIPWC